ncbi:MAG: hypothetical protein WD231_02115 [Candidatus Woykebacteria bacterium]
MNQITKIGLDWELFEQGVSKKHISERLLLNRETVHLWIVGIQSKPQGYWVFLNNI